MEIWLNEIMQFGAEEILFKIVNNDNLYNKYFKKYIKF